MTPYPRRQQLAIPASAIPAFAARYGMTVPELLAYHLEHGGRSLRSHRRLVVLASRR